MDLIEEINYELARMPLAKKMDPRQLPCRKCNEDFYARQEMWQVLALNTDNTNFAKDLMATYHSLLHLDIATGLMILYYKDIKSVVALQILAKKVKKMMNGKKDNQISLMCMETINRR